MWGQRLEHGEHGEPFLAAQAARNGVTIQRSLRSIGPLAGSLCLVLPQPHVDPTPLADLGFLAIRSGGDAAIADVENINPEAALIMTVGVDQPVVTRAVELLNNNTQVPTLIVVMVMPHDETQPPPSPSECVEHVRNTKAIRTGLFRAGADEVLCLLGGEPLQPHRISEAIDLAEYITHETSDIINAEVAAVQRKAAQRLQHAHRRFLMMLPGRALENLPCEDEALQEWRGDNGALVGVGDCAFRTKLGSGAFGHVFKAEHPKFGTCAVKVIAKKSLSNANILVALNRELCHLLYAEPHPNIIRAYDIQHATHNFYVIMDYAGDRHLQKFVKATLAAQGGDVLPRDMTFSFACQEASALAHLHNHLVCHRDLKPDNWIVSDDGTTLRLADFGLSMQLSGPAHQLRHSCGSLPFCAPEVFQSESLDFACFSGYDGRAGDMWSLGVNYMELLKGPYSIEKLLGWFPRHPNDNDAILAGLRSIATHWETVGAEEDSVLGNTITNLLKLQPSDRWRIGQVLGSQGLAVGLAAVRPPRTGAGASRGPLGRRGRQTATVCGDVPERRSAAQAAAMTRGDAQLPLSARVGGLSVFASAVNRMLDHLLWTPGFKEVFSSSPTSVHALRTVYCGEIEALLDHGDGEVAEGQRLRQKMTDAYAQLFMSDGHFDMLMKQFRSGFQHYDISEDVIVEAEARLVRFKPEATVAYREALQRANVVCTPNWRREVSDAVGPRRLSAFGECLWEKVLNTPVLRQSPVHTVGGGAPFEQKLIRYLQSEDAEFGSSPIPLPDSVVLGNEVCHLVFINAAHEALQQTGFSAEASEVLRALMLQEWSRVYQS